MAEPNSTNTSSAFVGYLKPRPIPAGLCIDPNLVKTLAGLFEVIVKAQDPLIIRSQTPPNDLRATWQEINSVGLPVGNPKQYNRATGSWGRARVIFNSSGTASFCLSARADQRTILDEFGCLLTPGVGVPKIDELVVGNLLKDGGNGWYVSADALKFVPSKDACNSLIKGSDANPYVRDRSLSFIAPFGSGAPCNGVLLPGAPTEVAPTPFDLKTIPEYKADCHTLALVWGKVTIGLGNGWSSGTVDNPAASILAGHDNQQVASMIDADPQEGSDTSESWVRLNPDLAARHLFKYHYRIRPETAGVTWAVSGGKDSMQAYIKAFQ